MKSSFGTKAIKGCVVMKAFLGMVVLFCAINLVPYLLGGILYFSEDGTLSQSLVIMVKTVFEFPSSIIWFIIQKELGDGLWITFNVLGFLGSGYGVTQF